jgi:histidine ammonia-lyase
MAITLHPGSVTLAQLQAIYWNDEPARLDHTFDEAINRSAARIAEIANGSEPVYGVNTGFGKLASIKIAAEDTATLQRNLILSHCCGLGEPLAPEIVRLVMALKLISLGRGASGVRIELIRLIEGMLERAVVPMIPEKGSVGASGDLAPRAPGSARPSACRAARSAGR